MIEFQLLLLQTLWFFLQIIRELNHSYPNLFNAGDEEIDEKEKDPVKKYQLRKRIVQARQTLNLVKNGTGFVE